MTGYSELLAKGAREIRRYGDSADPSSGWIEKMALRMETASALSGEAEQEHQIAIISRMLIDSGPLDDGASPSFWAAADAMRRAGKRR